MLKEVALPVGESSRHPRTVFGVFIKVWLRLTAFIDPCLDLQVASLAQHLASIPGLNVAVPFLIRHHEHTRPRHAAFGAVKGVNDKRNAPENFCPGLKLTAVIRE